MAEKEFTLKNVFENVGELIEKEECYSTVEEHYGVKWRIRIEKTNEHFAMYLYTNVTKNQRVHADFTMKIFSKNTKESYSKSRRKVFENDEGGWDYCGWLSIDWKTLEDEYLDDGKLEVEIHVKITKMVGFPREELRSFGKDMEQFSDVILKVKERKFYVLKLYLSAHSPYFATLFSERLQECEKSEIELKGVDPQNFQYYVEVIYAERGINDHIEGILSVADMYDTPLIVKKCKEFLDRSSNIDSLFKFQLKEKLRKYELGRKENSIAEKEFTLKYVFENVGRLERYHRSYGKIEEHFGVEWKIYIERCDEHLEMYLYTNLTETQKVHADFTMKIYSKNQKISRSKSCSNLFENTIGGWDSCGWYSFIDWETLEDEYLDDGKLEVEVHVKIRKMIGFGKYWREKLRCFGEDMKQYSDVLLKVKERKFYVLKLYLSAHSPYFATLFLGKFEGSEKSEVELKGVDPHDFQYYLEVLYGENGIDGGLLYLSFTSESTIPDQNVEGILSVADMFDTPLSVKKCEEFLIKESKMELKKKIELAGNYRLEELKKVCLDQIKSRAEIRSVIPENPGKMNPEILAELLEKSLAFD